MRRARWKRKNVRRVGLRRRRPPAAGGGRLAVPCGGQGRKRAALGETSSPGQSGIPSATLPAAAHASSKNSQRQRKEKLVKCVLAPRRSGHHPPRDGSIDLVEGSSVPEGQAKSALAPIRRLPSRGGPLHRSAPNAFLFGPCTARFSFGKTKEKWGVHPGWISPPCGSRIPVAAVRRPLHACVHRPLPPSSGRSASDPWVA